MVKSTALVSYFTAICAASVVPDPIVHLDHGALQGKFSEKYNITFFRRIPFAAPPIGNGRFNVPQQVQPWQGLYNTDQDFPMCPQGRDLGSEDCLYLGLYSRPWVPGSALRPVVVFIHGGGWTRGGGGFSIPPPGYPTLNVSNLNDFVLVYPNHRLNVFGLLPGKKIKNSDSAVLNPTLLDQEYALKWVQQHIAKCVSFL
jgi:carboxylesterase type B